MPHGLLYLHRRTSHPIPPAPPRLQDPQLLPALRKPPPPQWTRQSGPEKPPQTPPQQRQSQCAAPQPHEAAHQLSNHQRQTTALHPAWPAKSFHLAARHPHPPCPVAGFGPPNSPNSYPKARIAVHLTTRLHLDSMAKRCPASRKQCRSHHRRQPSAHHSVTPAGVARKPAPRSGLLPHP